MQTRDYRRLPVYRRGEIVAYTMVDADLFDGLGTYRWGLGGDGSYVGRNVKRDDGSWSMLMLHRYVIGADDGRRPPQPIKRNGHGVEIDHINRDRLDNRRANLRAVTRRGNAENTSARGGSSKYRGVSWDASCGRWRAFYGRHCLGLFESETEAASVAADFRRHHVAHSID